jgi:hypothetical protein
MNELCLFSLDINLKVITALALKLQVYLGRCALSSDE